MKLEKLIEDKCKEYIKDRVAYLYKLPTDWVVQRKGKAIVSAFPKKKSTIDFMGSYKGLAIGIETKSTNNTTSFSFSNIADHQWDFFIDWCKDAKGYYIVWFKELEKMYLIDAKVMQIAKDTLGRKSAPYDWFVENGTLIDDDLDFIKLINT